MLYAFAYVNSGPLRLCGILEFFYDMSHIGTGCSGTKNNNNKFKHQEREVEQQLPQIAQ